MSTVRIACFSLLAALLPNVALAAGNTTAPAAAPQQMLHGVVVAVSGDVLTLRLRSGQTQNVDIGAAKAAHHTGVLPIGGAVVVYGNRDSSGTFHATSIGHSSPNPQNWSPDK